MDREKKPPGENADAMLVSQGVLENAIEAVEDEACAGEFKFVEHEPLLSTYCRMELFQVLGKLAVAGATTEVVRGVGADIHRLISITANAMKSGYCTLLEDFLPAFSKSPPETTSQATEEGGAET